MRQHRSRLMLVAAALSLASACGGGGGGSGGTPSPPPPPPPPSQPGSVQFETSSVSVNEGQGAASIIVTRTGGADGAVSVTVTSSDGSATAGQDYEALSTIVNFGAGDSAAKTVTVAIIDDGEGEADETLSLALSATTGGATVGANTTATFTIQDDDPPAAPVLEEVTSDIKQLTFSWASVLGATSYRLLQSPDGTSGFTQIGADHPADATSATLDIAVHRHDWVNALYRLEACNARGCSASNATSAVDAMLQSIGYFKASNTEGIDRFGFAVALSADGATLVLGAPFEDSSATGVGGDESDNAAESAGAVYVFTRVGRQWSPQAYLKASNTEAGDLFGSSLALSSDGNTLAVGAPGEDSNATGISDAQSDNSAREAGAVYVFTRAGTQWSQQAYVKASNTQADDLFGDSVALDANGNTLAIGAPLEDSGATGVGGDESDNSAASAGAVYVFTRAGTQWSQQAYVKASNAEAFDSFGSPLALSADGSTLVVAAPSEDSNAIGVGEDENDNTALSAGAAYVFTRSGALWSQQAYLKASNSAVADEFSGSLALSADGNTLAVGARGEDSNDIGVDGDQSNNSASRAGAVYVFTRAGTLWSQQAYVKPSNTEAGDLFGDSLAISADGNTLAVGAPLEDGNSVGVGGAQIDNSAVDAGAVYVFTRAETLWSQQAYVKASNTEAFDGFGSPIALSADGNTLAVAASSEDSNATGVGGDQRDNSARQAGAVYMF